MSWDLHHTESERLAQAAQAALAVGNGQEARDLYRRAAEARNVRLPSWIPPGRAPVASRRKAC